MCLRPPPPPPSPHPFGFDPTYGYGWDALRQVQAPTLPADFNAFWGPRYTQALAVRPAPIINDVGRDRLGRRLFDVRFPSTDGVPLGAWLLLPAEGEPRQGLIVGHGYGTDGALNDQLPFQQSALLFPWCRGLGRSRSAELPASPEHHVLHGIGHRDTYVLAGCVADLWVSVSVLLHLFPSLRGRVGYIGTSFSGGLGVLALARDQRLTRAALHVPSFGHHPLRLALPTLGSAARVQAHVRTHPQVLADTLAYFDAAAAARQVTQPVLCACARFDPVVAPPGQFAIANTLAGPVDLLPMRAGHFDAHPHAVEEHQILTQMIADFFAE